MDAKLSKTTIAAGVRLAAGVAAGLAVGAMSTGTAEAKPRRFDPALYRNPLVLTSFLQDGRVDVRRNEMLEFKFSSILRKGSVDSRSIRILELAATGGKQATGALIVNGNIIRFDPTRTQRNYDDSRRPNSQVTDKDNPEGFPSFQDFDVEILAAPNLHVLKNSRGASILQSFDSGFRTNPIYNDPVPGQPVFVGIGGSGGLGFDPPRGGATGLVDEDALVILEFSEPIAIDTIDPSTSITVKRIAVNEQVPGFIRLDPADRSGRRFQFVPSLGFGSDEANKAGWDISVELTTAITDLAGNPLKRPVTAPTFRTRYVPGKASSSIITESFNNQTNMDPVSVTDGAEWNTIEKGVLRGGSATAYAPVDVIYTTASTGSTLVRTRVSDPIVSVTQIGSSCAARPNGSRAQMLYVPGDVGVKAAITTVGWGPSSNALFAATYPNIILKLGHTSVNALSADFVGNVNVGNPVQVYQGAYTVPQAKNIQPSDGVNATGVTPDPNAKGFWLWPNLTSAFEWNGVNNLVFDAGVQGGNNCQILRIAFSAGGVAFPNRRAIGSNYQGDSADLFVEPVVYDIRFNKRRRTTVATSKWYQLASDKPVFANPIVNPAGQPGGVTVLLEMEGADGKPDPLVPGGFIPNTTTATGFTTDVTKVNNHRFMRFRISMAANLTTGQSARLTSVQFPYSF